MSEEFESAHIEMDLLIESVRSAILASVDGKGVPLSSYAPVYVDQNRNFYV